MRLDQILLDSNIINTQITLMKQASPLKLTSPLSDIVLNRFCEQILPKIHDKIKWLKLETSSMERILLAANSYFNLRQLDLFIMNIETDDMHLFNIPTGAGYMTFGIESPIFSSTLVELHMNVYRFDDCLFLLDGRLNQLQGYGQCHIYSCPYTLTYYDDITNNFPGGLFNSVEKVRLFDERPFENEFFIRISQAFPFLKRITIVNRKPQNFKQEQQLNDNTQKSSNIEYSHLTMLHLLRVHDDYVEQFLFDTKTCLSNYIQLAV
ncbi:unnamed protein product, partial [Rotaria sordida]